MPSTSRSSRCRKKSVRQQTPTDAEKPSDLYPVHQPGAPSKALSTATKPQAPPTTATARKNALPSTPVASPTPTVPQTKKTKHVATKTSFKSQKPATPKKVPSPEPGINAEDFIPKGGYDTKPNADVTESEVLGTITRGHNAMTTVMSSRGKNLQIVRAMWTSGSTKTAVDSAISMNDPAVLVDLLNILNLKSGLWNLELCAHLVTHIKELLNSKYDSYVMTSCSALKIILRNFGPVIKSNLTAPPAVGVDISREERYRRCKSCYGVLCQARIEMDNRTNLPTKVSAMFREIKILMGNLD